MDKGTQLGCKLNVRVKAHWSTDGYWYPAEAEISGAVTEMAQSELARYMEAELGIAREKQFWSTDDE